MSNPSHLKIVWKEVSRIESFAVWGKDGKERSINESVHFHHRNLPSLGWDYGGHIASAVGFDWSKSVTVYVLKPDAQAFKKAGVDGDTIVAEVREAVLFFFEEGEERRGKVTAVING